MNETRTSPRTGWVRADQARGKEDIEREQTLIDDIKKRERQIRKLERRIRDLALPLPDIEKDDISQGSDPFSLTVSYQNRLKQLVCEDVVLTWDEMFSVIAPTMYGYIMRRGDPAYNQIFGQYSFEGALVQYIKSKIIDRCGNRQITVLPHQIDTILIQYKQLGLMSYTEKTEEEDGKDFRGYSLTPAGEKYITKLKILLRPSAH